MTIRWSDLPADGIADADIKAALDGLTLDAIRVYAMIETDGDFGAIASHVTRMQNALGFIKSGMSVKLLTRLARPTQKDET